MVGSMKVAASSRSLPAFIFIRDLSIETTIGVHEDERRVPRPVVLHLEIELMDERAAESDALVDTVDYGAVIAAVRDNLGAARHCLVEHLAGSVAELVMDRFAARRVRVSIAKPGVFDATGDVGVVLERVRQDP